MNRDLLQTTLLLNDKNIEDCIYNIRGQQVMLDSDLAKLYQVETKRINEAVNRNPDKFPDRFSFLLELNEFMSFEDANCDLKSKTRGGRRYVPRVFTEQGIAMLSTILKSKVAVETSIRIMDAFVKMRKYISANLIEQDNMKNMLIKHDNEIKLLISEIEYVPNDIDKERFIITMNDGNYVYITLYKITSINEYIKIVSTLNNKKGILYLDSGNYFETLND